MQEYIVRKVPLSERRYYDESFKRMVCEEFLRGGITKDALRAKYGIQGKSAILDWLRAYGDGQPSSDVVSKEMKPLSCFPDMTNPSNSDQAARIKELESRLEAAELKAKSLEVLIEVAERELQIDIRKKPVTKQSKK